MLTFIQKDVFISWGKWSLVNIFLKIFDNFTFYMFQIICFYQHMLHYVIRNPRNGYKVLVMTKKREARIREMKKILKVRKEFKS